MNNELIEITLKRFNWLKKTSSSFNNDFQHDEVRKLFRDMIPTFKFDSTNKKKVPLEYRFSNVFQHKLNEIYMFENKIVVGEYWDEGFIVPPSISIAFNQLYNCSPLISLIKGDKEYVSFLHTWAVGFNPEVVDAQVKNYMKTIKQYGDVLETIFAPRKNSCLDTPYEMAIDDIVKNSSKTIVLSRKINQITGIVTEKGVYFKKCGYHLWEK